MDGDDGDWGKHYSVHYYSRIQQMWLRIRCGWDLGHSDGVPAGSWERGEDLAVSSVSNSSALGSVMRIGGGG